MPPTTLAWYNFRSQSRPSPCIVHVKANDHGDDLLTAGGSGLGLGVAAPAAAMIVSDLPQLLLILS
jgi:hypothetical protein